MLQKYDELAELEFYNFCQLDVNPTICTDPVEASKYLGISLYISAEGFQRMIEKSYNQFTAYIEQFIQNNSIDNKIYLLATLNRLNVKYKNLQTQFNISSIRLDWRSLSENSILPLSDDNFNIRKKEKYTREAYKFFYKMAATQRLFIDTFIEYLLQHISSFNQDKTTIAEPVNQEKFGFILSDQILKKDELLDYLYDKLISEKYINCHKKDFKKLFSKTGEKPKPIIWCKDYIHLSYLIKQLSKSIIKKQTAPSEYEIASKLFFEKDHGAYFCDRKRWRHNTDPSKVETAIINSIVNYAEKSYLPPPATKNQTPTKFKKSD